ncbi:MAG: thiamine pyrophosphate-binding protein [Candidatus Bathyarchaeia archaeon]
MLAVVAEMNCGEVIIEVLSKIGCRYIFGTPGVHNIDVYRALLNHHEIRHILVKHETNAGVMADVYGRLTGEPGFLLTTAGPGATHCVTAVAQAYASASPLIHISGDVPTRACKEPFHGLDSNDFLVNVFKPVTKWATRVKDPAEVVSTLIKAYEISTSGRMGPIHISIPIDVMRSEYKGSLQIPEPKRWREAGRIDEIINDLLGSKKLVVYAGKDVSRYQCENKLLELCEILRAPLVVHGRRGNDDVVIPHDHPLYAGFVGGFSHPAAFHALNSADLVLSIGIRFGSVESEFLKTLHRPKYISITVENDLAPNTFSNKVIVGNLKETLTLLIDRLKALPQREADETLLKQISQIRREVSEKIDNDIEAHLNDRPLHPGVVIKILRSALDRDSILAVDAGLSCLWVKGIYPVYCIKGIICPGGYEAMGFSLPAAITTKIVYPERNVFAVTGDGGLLMSYSDLPTIFENNLKITVLVFNNNKYGAVWQLQKDRFEGKFIATDLQATDFAMIFRAFGGIGIRVETIEETRKALEEAVNSKEPTLIDIKTDFRHSAPSFRFFIQNPKLMIGEIID